jgi:DNA-binding GntR family transcriptional regulator
MREVAVAPDKESTASVSTTPTPEGPAAGRLTTADVYEALRRKILEHTIPPATKVNIHHLSQEFGVSPTPVREALRLLQGDNLLVATSNKGYATTNILDLDGVRNLFEFRLLVEPWAARTAATNRLHNPARALESELQQFSAVGDSLQHALISHDSRFHRVILDATGNPTVVQAFDQSHCHLHLFRMYRQNWDWQSTIREHEAIVEAIRSADPERAEEQMRNHLNQAYLRFLNAMNNPITPPADLRAPKSPRLILS